MIKCEKAVRGQTAKLLQLLKLPRGVAGATYRVKELAARSKELDLAAPSVGDRNGTVLEAKGVHDFIQGRLVSRNRTNLEQWPTRKTKPFAVTPDRLPDVQYDLYARAVAGERRVDRGLVLG